MTQNPIQELKYFLEHEDEFPEGASLELLKWCIEQEDFPEIQKRDAQNELWIRERGRALIAVPKEEPDGSLMKREDGETIPDWAYTKGNYRTSKTPELVCWYPSVKSTTWALNKVSDLLADGTLPAPTEVFQYCEDPFQNGTPVFYILLNEEERAIAQEKYVCQLDDDTPVAHLIIPAPTGDIQLQLIPDEMRPFDLEARPMQSSFLKEVCDKVRLEMNYESTQEWGKSEPVGLGNDEGLEELLPRVDYTPRNGKTPGSEDWGTANLGIALSFIADSLRYVLLKLAFLHSKNIIDYSTATIQSFGEAIEALAEKTGDSEIGAMCRDLWDNDPKMVMGAIQEIDPRFQLDGETLSYDLSDDGDEQEETGGSDEMSLRRSEWDEISKKTGNEIANDILENTEGMIGFAVGLMMNISFHLYKRFDDSPKLSKSVKCLFASIQLLRWDIDEAEKLVQYEKYFNVMTLGNLTKAEHLTLKDASMVRSGVCAQLFLYATNTIKELQDQNKEKSPEVKGALANALSELEEAKGLWRELLDELA